MSDYDPFSFSPPSPLETALLRLFTAATSGIADSVTKALDVEIIKRDRDLILRHVNGFNCLHSAARKGHLLVISQLLNYNSKLLLSKTADGRNSFMLACQESKLDTLKLLMSFSENVLDDIMAQDGNGNTIFHLAAWVGCIDILKYIVDDLKAPRSALVANNEGLFPQQMAAANNRVDILQLLTNFCNSITSNSDTSISNNVNGSDNKEGDNQGENTVFESVGGHLSAVTDAVASVSITLSGKGFSEVHRAAMYGALETLAYLISNSKGKGAVLDLRSENGSTPLHMAAENGHADAISLLIEEFGAGPDPRNESGLTPLMLACFYGHIPAVKCLLKCGADPLLASGTGSTCIGLAASRGEDDIISLLSAAVIKQSRNCSGGSALLGVELAEAHLFTKDNDGRSPIDLATQNGHKSTAAHIARLALELAPPVKDAGEN